MDIRKAVLIKTVTEDGHMKLRDGIEVGKEYTVDVDKTTRHHYLCMNCGSPHIKDMVWDTVAENWFPIELLKIEEGTVKTNVH